MTCRRAGPRPALASRVRSTTRCSRYQRGSCWPGARGPGPERSPLPCHPVISLPWSPLPRSRRTGAAPLCLPLASGPLRDLGRSWSQRWDSNPRPPDYKSGALPTELRWRGVSSGGRRQSPEPMGPKACRAPRSRNGSAVWYGRARTGQGSGGLSRSLFSGSPGGAGPPRRGRALRSPRAPAGRPPGPRAAAPWSPRRTSRAGRLRGPGRPSPPPPPRPRGGP